MKGWSICDDGAIKSGFCSFFCSHFHLSSGRLMNMLITCCLQPWWRRRGRRSDRQEGEKEGEVRERRLMRSPKHLFQRVFMGWDSAGTKEESLENQAGDCKVNGLHPETDIYRGIKSFVQLPEVKYCKSLSGCVCVCLWRCVLAVFVRDSYIWMKGLGLLLKLSVITLKLHCTVMRMCCNPCIVFIVC